MKRLRSFSLDGGFMSIETTYEYENGLLRKTITSSPIGSTSVSQFEYDERGKLIRETKTDNPIDGFGEMSQKEETSDIQYETLGNGGFRQIKTTHLENGCWSYINTEETIYESDGGRVLEIHREEYEEFNAPDLTDIFFAYDNKGRIQDEYYFSRHAEWNDKLDNYDIHYYNYMESHSYAEVDGKIIDTVTSRNIDLVDKIADKTVDLKDIVLDENGFQDVEPTKHYFIETESITPMVTRKETVTKDDGSYQVTEYNSVGEIFKQTDYDSEGNILERRSNGSTETYTYEEI